MAGQDESALHIPPFAKPLSPYVKSRQETLRIRRVLTLYLRSQITLADDQTEYAPPHLALCAPQYVATAVKRIPSDVTGLRREYLEALQANITARREYETVVERLAARKPPGEEGQSSHSETEATEGVDAGLQTYLKLLRDRRRHAKLQVFEHYLQDMKKRRERGKSGDGETHAHQPLFPADGSGVAGAGDIGVRGLVDDLERAIVSAKSRLDREKRMLEELKSRHESSTHSDSALPVKARALQRTRDELVKWVEDRLATASHEEATYVGLPAAEAEGAPAHLLDDLQSHIQEEYSAYVDARRKLLEVLSRAYRTLSTPAPKHPPAHTSDNPGESRRETGAGYDLNVLQLASEVFLPLSKSQKALILQKSYLAGLLAKEKTTALRLLDRLSSESHLLPEYPILARHSRFQHAVAALGSAAERAPRDEILASAEAWAFASDAARTNEQEHVDQQITVGMEAAQEARQTLEVVYGMMNQDLEAVTAVDDTGDIWASEVQSRKSKPVRPRGPWSRLNGSMG
ncbi:hypothetical protein ASPZODRAFT_132730 [Penicilliopsis zonata CBS 506.65]|uniref:Uncharacterized protein n=1 Tax=Penicilliopsis zonata CBS 506.65 TaxID=1073090 RepID=A0A1L9SHM5_9EURO|nr:hypothetical protein ASPZODRAFT_132730 [Penicilliopsis zonata CBS 506.65]OJJ46631.1 hypothetical protein ASPZODRAFT_132730 [Penicilliopsis zonata CBS 506.65]